MASKAWIHGVAVCVFALTAPFAARAGNATVHPFAITLKTVSQTLTGSGEFKPDPFTAKSDAIFEACEEALPTKTQGIFLLLDCDALLGNQIVTAETEPAFAVIQTIGEIEFDMGFMVHSTKNMMTKSSSVPISIMLACNTTLVQLHGIMDLKYVPNPDPFGADVCAESGKAKVVGGGSNPMTVGPFLVDDGSSISFKKRLP